MKKKTKKILSGCGIAAAAIAAMGAASYLLAEYLVRIALDREQPDIPPEKNTNSKEIPWLEDFNQAMQEASQRLSGYACEQAEIISHDGIKLVGHWRPCKNPKRILLAMHGWRASWHGNFGIIADFFYDSQCSVLYVEQRGQNQSGGDYMGFGMLERYDCLDWIQWINENIGTELPLYLCGVSMGASTVLMAAGSPLPENVHGIVADCGFTSADAIWRHVTEKGMHLSYDMLKNIAESICEEKIHISPGDYSTLEAMQTNRLPVLFVHGTDDDLVPVEMSYENYKACAGPKRLFVVPGANHGMSYYADREGYEAALKAFWNDFD